MALCGMFTAVMSVWAIWRRQNVGPALLVLVTLVATAVPVLTIMELQTCSSVEIPLIVTALTSLAAFFGAAFFAAAMLPPKLAPPT